MEHSLDDLKLAFSLHVVDQILNADDRITEEEMSFLAERFPLELLAARGLIGPTGERTDAYHEAAMAALERLPTELDFDAKVELLSVFVAATLSDGDFAIEEGNTLVDAARLLDMTDPEIDAFLQSRADVRARLAELESH